MSSPGLSAWPWAGATPTTVFGLLITVTILVVLRNSARNIYRLMDAVDPDLVEQVEEILAGTDVVEAVDPVRLRGDAHTVHAEAEVAPTHAYLRPSSRRHRRSPPPACAPVPSTHVSKVHTSPCDLDGTDPHARLAHHLDPPNRPEWYSTTPPTWPDGSA